jgi:uncharacterized protein GlcG (DUF336 family)
MLSLDQARAIIVAAHKEAAAQGLAAVSIVVMDASGAIRASERNDAAPPFGLSIALAKARTAFGFGRSSIKTAAVFAAQPAVVTGLSDATGGHFLPLGGGVVIVSADGATLGAAGLAGGMPDIDHAVLAAAVAAAGLSIKE